MKKLRIHELIHLGLLDEDARPSAVKFYLKLLKKYKKEKDKTQASLNKKRQNETDKNS